MESLFSGFAQFVLILIGITPVIFVITVSFLGRAINKAKKEKEKQQREHDKTLEERFREADKKHKEMLELKDGDQIKAAKESLDKIEKEKKRFEQEKKRTTRKYEVLSLNGSVLKPSACFLVALVLIWIVQPFPNLFFRLIMLIPIVFFTVIGIYQICRVMQVVVEVAQPSEEVFIASLKQALVEVEEAKKPILKLNFKGAPPFKVKKSSEFTITFTVYMTRGDVAKTVEVMFFVPSGFDYPSAESKWNQSLKFAMPNALSTTVRWFTILRGTNQPGSIKVKVPDTPGKYMLGYSLSCEGFAGELEKFDVIVEDQLSFGKLSNLLKDKPIRY